MSEMSKMMGRYVRDDEADVRAVGRGMKKSTNPGPKLEARDDDPRNINLTKQGFPL